jgi:hypothetical protein
LGDFLLFFLGYLQYIILQIGGYPMFNLESLSQQWNRIIARIAELGAIRPGTVCDQKVKYTDKDGVLKENGPYPILTFKENGKTRTIRLRSDEEVELVEKQIAHFRDFQSLTKELVRLGREMADCELAEKRDGKKNASSASKPSRKRKPRRSSSE